MSHPTASLDIERVRSDFPGLERTENGRTVAYLDGPGGTQTARQVIEAMGEVLASGVSNLGGGFASSAVAEQVMAQGRQAMADLFNCTPSEISFGQNMTSITFALSRALSRDWRPGEAIVVTSLDHDANYTPWVRAAADRDVEIRIAEFDPATGELDPRAVAGLLDDRVRLVATCLASNALGTVVDVTTITDLAHEAGAVVYLDAVHAGPHHLIDVGSIGCDFLVASAYKFFGPHTGALYGRLDRLAALDFYKVRPAPSDPPEKLETGTQSFESIAGVTAAVDYLAGLAGHDGSRRARLESAYALIREHEHALADRFLDGLSRIPGVDLHGVPAADGRRVATFALSVQGLDAGEAARRLVNEGIYVWAGHYYAVNAIDRLGFLDRGGLLRIGFVHYNTAEEVDRALDVLAVM
jgi:cysteine desulfurase family protein (TIGR01976 family)